MKLSIILLFTVIFQLFAASVLGQNTIIQMKPGTVTLEGFINEIEKQTDYLVVFSNQEINPKEEISLSSSSNTISNYLTDIFKGTDVHYMFDKNYIILTKRHLDGLTMQNVTITGTVTDAAGDPIPGVNIVIKGTTTGQVTDINGKYSINVPDKNAILIFSFIGYTSQEIQVGDQAHIDITLDEGSKQIEEVVVIGYGTKAKSTVTGSISMINSDQLESRPVARTTDLLVGAATNVQIRRSNSGRIRGNNSSMEIRGVNSRTSPGVLVVIDGIVQKENSTYSIDNINPEDIENISILKDAQAAIYGARGAGGVVLITTKNGKTEKPIINFSGTLTLQKPSLLRKGTDVLQIVEMMNEAYCNDGRLTNGYTPIVQYIKDNNLTMDKIAKNDGQYTCVWPFDNSTNFVFGHYDWSKIMFSTAPMQNYNLSVSGKTDKLNYYNSVGYVHQVGMMNYATNYNDRLFVRLKYDYEITKYLKVKTNFGFERQKVTEPTQYSSVEFWQGLIWPVFMPYNSKGHLYNFGSHENPIGYARDSGNTTDYNYRINSMIGLVLTPVKNLNITAELSSSFDILENQWAALGFDMYDENDKFSYNSRNFRNAAGTAFQRIMYNVANVYANYKFTLAEKNNFDFMAGYSHEEDDTHKFTAERRLGLISPELPTMAMGSSTEQYNGQEKYDRALNSFFSRLSYSYDNRYFIEGIFRYDGSSKFAKGHKWSPFGGISGAWNISNERFMSEINHIINFLKIRASWGKIGNEASIGYYDYLALINIGGSYPIGNPLSPAIMQNATLAGLASNTRTWEKLETSNVGLDFGVFNSRLTGSFDYFVKNTPNMFYIQEFPEVLGITAPSINGAHVQSKGWEVTLGWNDKIGDWGYFADLNLSNSNSKVIELADSRIPGHGYNGFVEGYPVGSYFGYTFDGIIQTEAELNEYTSRFTSGIPNTLTLGDARFKDLDGDGKLRPQLYELGKDGKPTENSGDLTYIGDEQMHYLFGIRLGASWKFIDFSVFFQGVLKWQRLDDNYPTIADSWPPQHYFWGNYWTENRRDATYPRLSLNGNTNGNNYQTSDAPYKLYNNRYIRLKNIQIGFSIPKNVIEKIKVDKARVYFSGTDVWEWYSIPGVYDPEKPFNPRITPFPRGFSFGLNLTF